MQMLICAGTAAFEESKNKTCKIQQRYGSHSCSWFLYPPLKPKLHRGVILLKVIEYLAYKVQYSEFNESDIHENFADRIDPYIALEL